MCDEVGFATADFFKGGLVGQPVQRASSSFQKIQEGTRMKCLKCDKWVHFMYHKFIDAVKYADILQQREEDMFLGREGFVFLDE